MNHVSYETVVVKFKLTDPAMQPIVNRLNHLRGIAADLIGEKQHPLQAIENVVQDLTKEQNQILSDDLSRNLINSLVESRKQLDEDLGKAYTDMLSNIERWNKAAELALQIPKKVAAFHKSLNSHKVENNRIKQDVRENQRIIKNSMNDSGIRSTDYKIQKDYMFRSYSDIADHSLPWIRKARFVTQPPYMFEALTFGRQFVNNCEWIMSKIAEYHNDIPHDFKVPSGSLVKLKMLIYRPDVNLKSYLSEQHNELRSILSENNNLTNKRVEIYNAWKSKLDAALENLSPTLGRKNVEFKKRLEEEANKLELLAKRIRINSKAGPNASQLDEEKKFVGKFMSDTISGFTNFMDKARNAGKGMLLWNNFVPFESFTTQLNPPQNPEMDKVNIKNFTIVFKQSPEEKPKAVKIKGISCAVFGAYPLLYDDHPQFNYLNFDTSQVRNDSVVKYMMYPFAKEDIDLGDANMEVTLSLDPEHSLKTLGGTLNKMKAREVSCSVALLGGKKIRLHLELQYKHDKYYRYI